MHLRISTVRRGDKTYRYAQLVESYRREQDGRPAHRILASLGALTDEAIANLRLALEATRTGEALVVPPRAVAVAAKPVVRANYRLSRTACTDRCRGGQTDPVIERESVTRIEPIGPSVPSHAAA